MQTGVNSNVPPRGILSFVAFLKRYSVTGGSTGLGLAITRCLVSAGAKVCVVSFETPDQAADALAEFGDRAVFYQFDITDTDHAQELVDRIVQEQGRIDILINNAGNHCKKFIWDMTVEDYKRVLDVHLVGSFAMTKAVVPYMKEQQYGRVVFQASMTSYIGQPQVAGYSTAKAGFLGLIHTLTAELAEYGITVNAIAPGVTLTDMTRYAKRSNGNMAAENYAGRNFLPEEVAEVACFLISDASKCVSGQIIFTDGGDHIKSNAEIL